MRRLVFLMLMLVLVAAAASAQQRNGGGGTGSGASTSQANTWTQPQTFSTGISLPTTDATVASDPNDRRAADLNCTTDSATSNPGFTDENCAQIAHSSTAGNFSYGNGSNSKTTFFSLYLTGSHQGAGQRFVEGLGQTCYGMGDCAVHSDQVTFAAGNINGDEGVGFSLVNTLQQQPSLTSPTATANAVRTSCNTTLTQSVTGAAAGQSVTVASATGCNVGDWVEIQAEKPTAAPNHEAVKLTGVGVGSVTGIFKLNHPNAATVTPAVKLALSGSGQLGQGRVLVDKSRSPYTTGTISAISGFGLTGSGTGWSGGMVGDNGTTSTGCLYLSADDYTGSPFSSGSGALHAWYQIIQVLSGTSLQIYKTSVAGDSAYQGKGPGSGGYAVYPCAEILVAGPGFAILATNSATWSNGDSLEEVIPPYPDVTGHSDHYAVYTPGGALRAAWNLQNTGARTFNTAILINANMPSGGGADALGWGTGLDISGVGNGLTIRTPTQVGIEFTANNDIHSVIHWGPLDAVGNPVNAFIGPTAAANMLVHTANASDPGAIGDTGSLSFGVSAIDYAGYVGRLGLAKAGSTLPVLRFFDAAATAGDPNTATSWVNWNYRTAGAGGYHGVDLTGSDSGATLVKFDFGNQQTTLAGALEVGAPTGGMPAAGTINAQGLQVNGTGVPQLGANNSWTGAQSFAEILGTVTTQSGASYTLAAGDCGTLVRFTNAGAVTATLPNSLVAGCTVALEQAGAGQVTLSAGAGAALHSAHSYSKTFGQYSVVGVTVDGNSGGASAVYIMTGDGA